MINKQFLKNILTTASTLAITMGASEALAVPAARTITSSPASTTTAANFGGTFNDGDWMVFGASTNSVVFNNAYAVEGINMNSFTPTGSLTASVSGGSSGSIGGGGGSIPLIINDGISFSLTGTPTGDASVASDSYQLSSITLGSTKAGAAGTTLIIDTHAEGSTPTWWMPIDSYSGATGNLGTVTINGTALFQGAFGSNSPLAAVNIGQYADGGAAYFGSTYVNAAAINLTTINSTLWPWGGTVIGDIFNTSGITGNTNATTINLNGDTTFYSSMGTANAPLGQVYFAGDHAITIDSTASARNIHAPFNTATGSTGTLATSGGNNIEFFSAIGVGNALKAIDTSASTAGTITFDGNVRATTITTGPAAVTFSNTTLYGGSTLNAGAGLVTFGGATVPATINFANAASRVLISGMTLFSSNVYNTTGVAGKGILEISTNNIALQSGLTVGASGKGSISGIEFMDNHTLTLNNNNIYGSITTVTNGQGTINVATHDSYIYGSVGTSSHNLSGINFSTNNAQTLYLNSSAGNIDVYSPLTTTQGDATGLIHISGTNAVTFHDAIGANGASLGNLSVDAGATVIFDSAIGTVYIYQIDGTWNGSSQGTLKTTGSGNLTFNHDVGNNDYFSVIDTTASTLNGGGTNVITFNGYGNADTMLLGSVPVVVNTIEGNVHFTAVAPTAQITVGGNGTYRTFLNTSGTPGQGTLVFPNSMPTGDQIGLSGNGTLNQVLVLNDSTITLTQDFNAGTNTWIYAPVATGTNNTGTLNVQSTLPIYGDVGANGMVFKLLTITTADTLSLSGSLYATATTLTNNGATLSLMPGTQFGYTNIYTPIDGANGTHGQGIINVGVTGAFQPLAFRDAIGSAHPIQLLTLADSATPWTASTTSTALLFAGATLDGQAGGTSGIRIGDGATLVVNGGNLTLTKGASIDGSGTNGTQNGTLVLGTGQALPYAAGANHPLQSVIFVGFNAGVAAASVSNDINALNVDLQQNSRILLDGHVSNTHVTGTRTMNSVPLPTGIMSSDGSGTAAVNGVYGGTYAEFAGAANTTTTVGNVGVPIKFSDQGTLSIAGTTPSFDNDTTVTFFANGILSVQDGGTLYGVASNGGAFGTVTNAGSVTFLDDIGANGANIHAFNPAGAGTITFPDDTWVYAATTNIGSGTYAIGDNTVTVAGGTSATLSGNIVINANYTGDNQIVLDLSGMTGLTDNSTSIAFYVGTEHVPPVHSVSIIKMINLPAGTTLATIPTVTSSSGHWVLDDQVSGQVSYYERPFPPAPIIQQHTTTSSVTATGPNGSSLAQVESAILQAGLSGLSNTEILSSNGSLFDKSNISQQASIPAAGQLSQSEQQILRVPLDALATSVTAAPGSTLSQANLNGIAQNMNELGEINSTIASVLEGTSGVSATTSQELGKILVTNGPSGASAVEALTTGASLNAVASRTASIIETTLPSTSTALPLTLTTHTAATTTAAQPASTSGTPNRSGGAPSSAAQVAPSLGRPELGLEGAEETEAPAEDLEASAYGMAAGNNPYEKFGVWGMINGGFAQQKMLKGTSGFKSISKGMTIGVDTMINDKSTIGYSISNSTNNVKLKDANVGDKTRTSSWVATIYGNHQLRNNWFIRGAALFNRTNINSKSLRPGVLHKAVAQAKYNLISYGGEASVGFAHMFKNGITLTPSVGMRVIHNNSFSYSETGNTILKTSMKQNAIDNYSALFGLSVSKGFTKYGFDFTPEAHANMQYGVNTKTPQGTFVSPLTPNQTSNFVGQKASKFSSTYGASLTGSGDRLECGVTADVTMSQRYVGYQGSLKLKVKF